MATKSIIQENRTHCFLCGRNAHADYYGLDCHHIWGNSNRKKSDRYGLVVYICHDKCHLNGVHKNAKLDRELKAKAQEIAMQHYGWSTEDFIREFGKNYL
jgi:hypothetical protein